MIRIACMISVLCVLAACGRKQRNIFIFDDTQSFSINKLALGVPRIIEVKSVEDGNLIRWMAPVVTDDRISLVGYNVYRLTPQGLIPKKPLHTHPCSALVFIDKNGSKSNLYVVRAVFSAPSFSKEGPVSNVKMCM
jgi:hypothetical protein